MVAALVYLQVRSFWNRVRVQVRRLRQPKYLAGALVGGAYVYFFLFRGLASPGNPGGANGPALAVDPGEHAALIEIGGALLLGLVAAAAWVFPSKRAALDFTEAEIAFLFPAPISRSALIHYRILRAQLPLWFGALIIMFFTGRLMRSGHQWMIGIGWWWILASLELHRLGAAFARTRLMDRGVTSGRRRLVVVGVLLAVATVFWMWARWSLTSPAPEDFASAQDLAAYVHRTADSGPWFWLLLPLRVLVRPMVAGSPGAFGLALIPAAGLIAVLYAWVLRSQVSFEEASLDQARARATAIAAARSGRLYRTPPAQKRRAPFRLKPTGPRAAALAWKNLIAMGMTFTPRFWASLAIVALVGMVLTRRLVPDSTLLKVLGAMPVALVPVLFFIVPQVLTTDLRQDMAMIDALKTYPLPGWQVLLGEVLAPGLVLTGVQGACIVWGVCFFPDLESGEPLAISQRLSLGLACLLVAPGLNLISLTVHNAGVLLLPGWVRGGTEHAHGFEAMGRGILFMVAQVTTLGLALLVPAAALSAVLFVGRLWVPWTAVLPLGAAAALGCLLLEVYAALRMLGDYFERMDVSE